MVEIEKIAQIAFLKLDEDEKAICQKKIENIKKSAEAMLQEDLSAVAPTTKLTTALSYREDMVIPPSKRDDLLSNCKNAENGAFVVPKIVE